MKNLIMFLAAMLTYATDCLAISLESGPWVKHFAKIKFGMFITEMRGKVGGTVISRNRGGAYTKNKVTPLNPNTSYQQTVKARLAALSQGWRGLTEAQRVAWDAIVDLYARTDVFGDLRNPSGQQLYIRVNANLENAGQVAISDPVFPVGVDAIVSGALVMNSVGPVSTIAYTPTPTPAAHALIVEATEQLSQGIMNANSKFRQVEVFAPAQVSPADFSVTYAAKFGALVTGTKVFSRIRQIRTDTGEVSGTSQSSTTTL